MKALVLRNHGALDDLAVVSDYSIPTAAAGHAVIRVRASSFNYHDVFTVRGMPGIKVPLPVVIGLDMAGGTPRHGARAGGGEVGAPGPCSPPHQPPHPTRGGLARRRADRCASSADP